jgi:hypothetical protein
MNRRRLFGRLDGRFSRTRPRNVRLRVAARRDLGDRRLREVERGEQRPAGASRPGLVLSSDFLVVACIAAEMIEQLLDVARSIHDAASSSCQFLMPGRCCLSGAARWAAWCRRIEAAVGLR